MEADLAERQLSRLVNASDDVLERIRVYLIPSDVAQLTGTCCRLRRWNEAAEEFWTAAHETSFGRPLVRGQIDDRLAAFQLFCRKALKPSYKRAPACVELAIQVLARAAGEQMPTANGEAPVPLPEQLAAAEASTVGAMRFMHLTRTKVVIGSSDQGQLAAWSLVHHARRATALATSLQADAFAVAVGAKSRRDAKKKYASTPHESRLVYFKIAARNAKTGGGVDGLDLWGGVAADEDASHGKVEPRVDASDTESGCTSDASRSGTGSRRSASGGFEETNLSDASLPEEETSASLNGPEWVLDEWESSARSRMRAGSGRTSVRRKSGGIAVPIAGATAEVDLLERKAASRTSGASSDGGSPKASEAKSPASSHSRATAGRGKELWSPEDREKAAAREARRRERRAEKATGRPPRSETAKLRSDSMASDAGSQASPVLADIACDQPPDSPIAVIESAIAASRMPCASPPDSASHAARRVPAHVLDAADALVPEGDVFRHVAGRGANSGIRQPRPDAPPRCPPTSPQHSHGKSPSSASSATAPKSPLSSLAAHTSGAAAPTDILQAALLSATLPVSAEAAAPARHDIDLSFDLAGVHSSGAAGIGDAPAARSRERAISYDSAASHDPPLSTDGSMDDEDVDEKRSASSESPALTSKQLRAQRQAEAKALRELRAAQKAALKQARRSIINNAATPSASPPLHGKPGAAASAGSPRLTSAGSAPLNAKSVATSTASAGSPPTPTLAAARSPPKPTGASPKLVPSAMATGPAATPPGGPSLGALSMHPRGSKLRADIWFGAQWCRLEPACMIDKGSTALFSAPGYTVGFHAITCFQDGTLGVLSPHYVSARPNDCVMLSRGAVLCNGSDQVPRVECAQHLAAPTARRNLAIAKAAVQQTASSGEGHPRDDAALTPPSWHQHAVTWLERPHGEHKDRVAHVCVCKGRTYMPRGFDSPARVMEPDVIFAAFGRAVGIWIFNGIAASTPTGEDTAASAASASKPEPATAAPVSKKGNRATARHQQAADTPIREREPDVVLPPYDVCRMHAQLVTAIAVHTRRADDMKVRDLHDTDAVQQYLLARVTVASGDAGGEIVLWSAASLTKVASLQLQRKGVKEGVACVAITADCVVAGGSEGTVAIWRRRFAMAAAGDGPVSELAPELVLRETAVHTIVRMIHTPPEPWCALACVITGGGEGDVRVWQTPRLAVAAPGREDRAAVPADVPAPAAPVGDDARPVPLVAGIAARPKATSLPGSHAAASAISASRLLKGHGARVTGLMLDNFKLITASLDGTMKIWDIQEPNIGRPLQTIRLPGEVSTIFCLGDAVAVGTVDGRAFLYEFANGPRSSALGAAGTGHSGAAGGSTLLSALGNPGLTRKVSVIDDAAARDPSHESLSGPRTQQRDTRSRMVRGGAVNTRDDFEPITYTSYDLQAAWDSV